MQTQHRLIILLIDMMEIKIENPPNYDILKQIFKLTDINVYAYSPDIYNPNNCYLDPVVILHEKVHIQQQGDNPVDWWNRYIVDSAFRFTQELAAYSKQYRAICEKVKDRNAQARHLHTLAVDLSSKTYGDVCTLHEATMAIKQNVKFKV